MPKIALDVSVELSSMTGATLNSALGRAPESATMSLRLTSTVVLVFTQT